MLWWRVNTLKKGRHRPKDSRPVPIVKESLYPIVGNGLGFSKDIMGFTRKCRQKYGPIFKLSIFRKEIVVICDHKLKKEFFTAKEDTYPLYDILDSLYFSDAFTDDPKWLTQIIGVIKKSITVRYEEFAPKIMDESKKLIKRLRKKCDGDVHIDLPVEIMKFIASTSARCFIGLEITPEFYGHLLKFTKLLNKIVVLTYFLPKWFIRLIFNPFLRPHRKNMTKLLSPIIKKYRENKDLKDSLVLRTAVDTIDVLTEKPLTDEQIGSIIVCLLYVSSENTALGLTATIADLCKSEKDWNMVKNATIKHMSNNDIKSLFSDPEITACIMESARINTHIFPLNRKPIKPNATIGGYYVGDVDCVVLCEPIMMMYEDARSFKNSDLYNPSRFLGKDKESMVPYNVMTWGAGIHLCPGKMFAIYEMIAALAMFTTNLERINLPKNSSDPDYFSPSAFVGRTVYIKAKSIDQDIIDNMLAKSKKNFVQISSDSKSYNIECFDGKGWLIRNFLTTEEQKSLYVYTVELSEGSNEHTEINNTDGITAFPITYENLVYTGTSNCIMQPKRWYNLATKIWKLIEDNKKLIKFPVNDVKEFNSLYAQLFSAHSKMDLHKDQYVTWGVSVSIGASCDFQIDNDIICINSGDVFIADFSKVNHSVVCIHENTIPGWFSDEFDVKTFDRARCSIQIRDITDKYPKKFMSIEEFKNMTKNY
jgi:cytochrome P450